MISINAYAKINIGLRILGKRDDGYHNIETVFHRVHPFDTISLEPSHTLALECSDRALAAGESNLCLRTAALLKEHARVPAGVRITLRKDIPVGAGLGGGSSDAAATLLGLVQLWGLSISDAELQSLALRLGSDVPYFLKNGTAQATGRGEQLEYFDLTVPYWTLVVYPGISVSTPWAYGAIDDPQFREHGSGSEENHQDISMKEFLIRNINNADELNHHLRNDFEPVVLHAQKKIGYLKLLLYSEGACFAQMSGSGSAVYGFFTSKEKVDRAAGKVSRDYRVFLTPPDFRV